MVLRLCQLPVSIPSSSGQSFQPMSGAAARAGSRVSFNPFFIRSILPTVDLQGLWLWYTFCFNPFFIRSILPTKEGREMKRIGFFVSIPSSSGQSFQRSGLGTSPPKTTDCFNPFFIRSILPTRQVLRGRPDRLVVSIPSSSGQSFQPHLSRGPFLNDSPCFNPFFIRSILPTRRRSLPAPRGWCPVSIPSSSGQSFQRHTGPRTSRAT